MSKKSQNDINAELYARIEQLEKQLQSPQAPHKQGSKQRTLPELIKGKKFKNGQQKVCVIVAYYEKYAGKTSVTMDEIAQGWRDGKFDNTFARTLLERAVIEGFVRDLKDSTYDLSQSGGEFYEEFMK